MARQVDVLVIGAGPGGYPAAIRSAQLGMSVLLVEKQYIGGECLNWGCIPSKAIISAADLYHRIKNDSFVMGITVEGVSLEIKKLQQWKKQVIGRLVGGIKQLLKSNNVETLMGTARFLSQVQVEINLEDGTKEIINPKNVILATGAEFITLSNMKNAGNHNLNAKEALDLEHIPEELVVVGGGAIGLELGIAFAKLGAKVKIIELLPEILPTVDPTLVRFLKRNLKKLGIEIHTESKATNVTSKDDLQEIEVETKKNGIITLTANKCLTSIGKRASTSLLGLDKAGIKTDKQGFIQVNNKQQTNIPHIYAVGDCTGVPFLAHKAMKQGTIAAEIIAGEPAEADFKAMPMVIFTDPEIAYVGMTEQEAKDAGYNVITTRASFAASGKAMVQLAEEGFVKVVVNADSGVLLGAQIIGPHASDLISEVALALEMGATAEDIAFTIHPHPTLPEMIMEALEATLGKAIHISNPKRRKQ